MDIPHSIEGLKPIRKARGFTMVECAKRLGMLPTSYNRYEDGSRHIYFAKAKTLAHMLDCTLDDLARNYDRDPPPPPLSTRPVSQTNSGSVVATPAGGFITLDLPLTPDMRTDDTGIERLMSILTATYPDHSIGLMLGGHKRALWNHITGIIKHTGADA